MVPTAIPTELPKAAPAPQAVMSVGEVQAEIVRVFGSGWLGQQALCIAKNESGFQEKVAGPKRWINGVLHIGNTDGSVDRGIFQLNNRWHPNVSDAQAYNAKFNIQYAYKVRMSWGNWNAWMARTKCGL